MTTTEKYYVCRDEDGEGCVFPYRTLKPPTKSKELGEWISSPDTSILWDSGTYPDRVLQWMGGDWMGIKPGQCQLIEVETARKKVGGVML